MTTRLIRGRILSFDRMPQGIDDTGSYDYVEDGAVLIRKGLVVASGQYADVKKRADEATIEADHRPHLITAGFIDTHIHFSQMQVIGSYAGALLEWLENYTFVEEQRFHDEAHSARIASAFFDELVRHGTTTAVSYCSVHKTSADAFFAEAHRRNMRMIGGKVMMDRNAPPALCDTPQDAYDDTKSVIEEWHGKGRQMVAITPRFAITSTPAQMEVASALMREHPDLHMQTHLSENHAEIAFAKELFPWSSDYTHIYEHYGLLGPTSLFGHCIHLSDREADVMAESGSIAVFCPTSNLFLGSGLFDLKTLDERDKPVRIAVATDVGGGTNYSMLRTIDEGYKVLQLQGQRMTPLESFYRITLGNALALGLEDRIGTLRAGREADLVVLNASATPAMALKMEAVSTLAEELFLLQTLGDDRAIVETYIAGEPAKSVL
ncbi:MAG: guanine deaminase [Pseudomonadota bacterium]